MTSVSSTFELIDDDGVFVATTRKNLVALCPPKFEYEFPGIFVAALRSGHAIPWGSPMESHSQLTLRTHLEPGSAPRTPRAGFLEIPHRDELVVLPWSTLTLALDGDGGEVRAPARLATALPAPPGWYELFVAPPVVLDGHPRGVDLRWALDLVPLAAPPSSDALAVLEVLSFELDD